MTKVFADRLKELRGSMSQQEIADKIGTKQTSYSSWERGIKEPGISVLIDIASTFGVSTDWLLGRTDERTGVAPAAASKVLPIQPELLKAIQELKRRMAALESSAPLATCG